MRIFAGLLIMAFPLSAQQWSASVSSGPFVFGAFAERSAAIGNGTGGSTTHSRLSASTRVGAAADIERDFGRWFGVRLEAAWAGAPLSLKSSSGGQGVSLEAGRVNVTTVELPLVVHLNRGAFRLLVMGGPAYGLYKIERRASGGVSVPLFQGRRGRWGAVGGFGASWWLSPRFGVEWQAADTVTGSPFHVEDIAANSRGVHILRPQNGHSTLGVRYRF